MITYKQEGYTDVLGEMKNLFKSQWEEVGLNALSDRNRVLDPNWSMYEALDGAGNLHVYTARIATSGNLVGHCMSVVYPHPHSKNVIAAENDFLYLSPKYRTGFTGVGLINFAVEELKKVAEIIFFNTHVHNSFFPILHKLGFKLIEHRAMLEV